MGCVSSALLEEDGAEDNRRRIISHHHIVSLTSSTYGILTSPRAYCSSSSSSTAKPIALGPEPLARCAPPPPPPPPPPPLPPPPTTARQQAAPAPKPESQPQAEVINSWELMAGLVDPSTPAKPTKLDGGRDHQRRRRIPLRAIDGNSSVSKASPPPSSSAVVLYTTSLRGVRVTFEACNAVRAALQAHGVAFRERDVSMDRGFRDELRSRLGGGRAAAAAGMLPRLFVRGRHVGGAEDVLRLDEEGLLARLLEGLPRARGGAYCCDGCGGMRFLPCFDCSGSRKLAVTLPVVASSRKRAGTVVVRCGECNENGLVLCPICS